MNTYDPSYEKDKYKDEKDKDKYTLLLLENNHFVVLKILNCLLLYQYKHNAIIANYLFIVLLSMLDNYAESNYRKCMHDVAH